MGWVLGIFAYLTIWSTALFMVLPFFVQRNEAPEVGHDPGAPVIHNLKKKLWINTVFSFVIWLVVYWLVRIELFDFRAMVAAG